MGSKRITVSDEAYDALVKHRKPGESFTEEITRLLGRRLSQEMRKRILTASTGRC